METSAEREAWLEAIARDGKGYTSKYEPWKGIPLAEWEKRGRTMPATIDATLCGGEAAERTHPGRLVRIDSRAGKLGIQKS